MDDVTQPTAQVTGQPQPVAPTSPMAEQSTPPSFTPEPSNGSKLPLILISSLFFLVLVGGMGYYIMQPQAPTEETPIAQLPTPTPSSAVVAQTAEEQEIEDAVSYSLDDSFAELEKDLEGL
jgi:hypothetical protein